MRTLNLKGLRRLIEGLPDDLPIVVPSSDHSYRGIDFATSTTAISAYGHLSEDHGSDGPPLGPAEKRVKVLVIH